MSKDLFGNELKPEKLLAHSGFKRLKQNLHYCKSNDKNKCCKKCKNLVCQESYRKRYYKCHRIGISRSEATDIRLSYVCILFKEI
jgi:hypothetical protein